jgi:predicted transglutaminase-like protease
MWWNDIKISKATVLKTDGCDIVFLTTELPSPLPKITDQTLTLKFDAEKGTGEDYVYQKFGIQDEVISANSIGNYIYFLDNKSIDDSKKFENFKRTIRTIFNRLEEKQFIIRKNGVKPNFDINSKYLNSNDLFTA